MSICQHLQLPGTSQDRSKLLYDYCSQRSYRRWQMFGGSRSADIFPGSRVPRIYNNISDSELRPWKARDSTLEPREPEDGPVAPSHLPLYNAGCSTVLYHNVPSSNFSPSVAT